MFTNCENLCNACQTEMSSLSLFHFRFVSKQVNKLLSPKEKCYNCVQIWSFRFLHPWIILPLNIKSYFCQKVFGPHFFPPSFPFYPMKDGNEEEWLKDSNKSKQFTKCQFMFKLFQYLCFLRYFSPQTKPAKHLKILRAKNPNCEHWSETFFFVFKTFSFNFPEE